LRDLGTNSSQQWHPVKAEPRAVAADVWADANMILFDFVAAALTTGIRVLRRESQAISASEIIHAGLKIAVHAI
jgi:hypothetical protein